MSVTTVIEKMANIQDRLRELASDIENIQLSFDGQATSDAPPKVDKTLPGNFVGAVIAQEEYTLQLISHLQGKINFLANSLYPNSRGQVLATEATKAMAQKLQPRSPGITAAAEAAIASEFKEIA